MPEGFFSQNNIKLLLGHGVAFVLGCIILWYMSNYLYPLFHFVVELFAIMVGYGIFMVAWSGRRTQTIPFLTMMGMAFPAISNLDLIHAIYYPGMKIIPDSDINTPTQLWIAARLIEILAIFVSMFAQKYKRIEIYVLIGYVGLLVLAVYSIIFSDIFPDCYIDGKGLTKFKIYCEYIIMIFAFIFSYMLYNNKNIDVSYGIKIMVSLSIFLLIPQEFMFTLYKEVGEWTNFSGHLIKVFAFLLLYKALLETAFTHPMEIMFKELKDSRDNLENIVRERTRELEDSEKKYRRIIDTANEAIVVYTKEGRITFANRWFYEMFGYTNEEISKIRFHDLYYSQEMRFIEEKLCRKKIIISEKYDVSLKKKNGERIWAIISVSPIKDKFDNYTGALAMLTDITKRKLAEFERVTSLNRLKEIERIANVGGWGMDINTNEMWLSDGAYRILEIQPSSKNINIHKFLSIISEADRDGFVSFIEAVKKGEKISPVQHSIILSNSKEKIISEHAELIYSEEGNKIIGTIIDITNIKNKEKQLNQNSRLAILGEMAVSLAHEIGQPINAIKLNAATGLLKSQKYETKTEEHKEIYKTIDEQARRLSEIIKHMRLFARDETMTSVAFNACNPILSSIELLSEQFKGANVVIEPPDPKKCTDCAKILGHPGRLEQVIVNLLINARDAVKIIHKDGGGIINTCCTYNNERKQIVIKVEDNGPGVPEELKESIFQPFFSTKPVEQGTGLGLSISQSIIMEMGGSINIYNKDNGGAAFEIIIPTINLHDKEIYQVWQPAADEDDEDFVDTRYHILIVDDDMTTLRSWRMLLENRGFRISTAENGQEAISLFTDDPADLVISDLFMPLMDGKELAKSLQKISYGIPIILSTARNMTKAEQEEVKNIGINSIVEKPVEIKNMLKTINKLLKK